MQRNSQSTTRPSSGIQMKRGRRDSMSEEGQDHNEETTDTTGLSSWELMDSRTTVNEPARDDLGALHVGSSCVASSACEISSSGFRIYPWCMFWLCGTHSLWWEPCLTFMQEGGSWSCLNLITPRFENSL